MALNFPDNPSINDVYVDNTSGFSYKWDGTVWISYTPSSSNEIKTLDDVSGSFDGIQDTFALTSNSFAITPPSSQSLIINLGGVIQDPTDDYSVSGSNIIFSTPPTNGLSFSGVSLGPAVPINTIPNGTVTDGSLRISTNAVVGAATTFTEDLVVEGDARITGILTVGTSSITLDGSTNQITVGSGVTIYGNTGIISATSFYGDGANLVNTGSTLSSASGTQRVVVTSQTSGTMTASATDADLTFDATTNTLSVSQVSVGIVTATELQNTRLVGYSEKLYNYGNTGATPNINLSNGTYVLAILDQSAVFTFTMPVGIQTGLFGFTLQLKNSAGSLSIVWPGNVYWSDTGISTVPARTVTNGKTDIWSFLTYDSGSTWLGSLSLLDYNV